MSSRACTPVDEDASAKRSPRDRLVEAASELFYAEGIQPVGINRVIERAGVAKDSLYRTFGSKEALVCAYVGAQHQETLARLRRGALGGEIDAATESYRHDIHALFSELAAKMDHNPTSRPPRERPPSVRQAEPGWPGRVGAREGGAVRASRKCWRWLSSFRSAARPGS
jgi:AcrR family transcriptional regulator